jgi:asparagine synthase (glutamine-hydrolysing)
MSPEGHAALGHRRLSIIDTSHGSDQPFVSADGKLILVFNGEIYNYLELRVQLEAEGVAFRTHGDTEVLLAAYQHWGADCLQRFNGMWAFAIWDRRRGGGREQLFVARDRVGEKPFYYRCESRRFEFASELKGLRTGLHTGGAIDLQALNHYLALGYVPGDLCIVAGVHKLPPAHAGLFDLETGHFRSWRYWQLPTPPSDEAGEQVKGEDLAEQAWSLLTDSVRLRLRSDVPTGVFLSGGLDSSLVTAAAAQVSSQPIKTFTIGIPGSPLDETAHAQQVARAFDTEHHVLSIEAPSLDLLDTLAPFIDEPIADSSILPSFLVSRMTRQHVTVALGGDGGDELYGGYRHYQNALRDQARLGWVPTAALRLGAKLAATLPAGIPGRNRLSALRGGPAQSSIWGTPYFDLTLRRRLLTPEVLSELGATLDAPERRSLALCRQAQDPVDGLMRMDFQQVMPDDYLVKVDRASMANSLEVRTPFLDHRLVEHAFGAIPPQWKCTVAERRRVQNLMAKRWLPEGFELNRKQGFSVPMDGWMREAGVTDMLEPSLSGLFNSQAISALRIGLDKGRSNGARLFCLLILGLTLKL